MATLAIAEVASSADFAGVASPANLAGMAFPAVAGIGITAIVGEVSLTNVARMALPATAREYPQPSVLVSRFWLLRGMILATSAFDRMCVSDPRMCSRLHPFGRRLDSSPLMVRGELDMTVAFPGLSCAMVLVVASIGSEGLLGTDALQSCLPHQLDLQMGQLWADGRSTLQLHQQRQAARVSAHLMTSLVLPPDSESLLSESPGMDRHLPDHLEYIVAGSHPSLGEEGRMTLRNILHQYTVSGIRGACDGTDYVRTT